MAFIGKMAFIGWRHGACALNEVEVSYPTTEGHSALCPYNPKLTGWREPLHQIMKLAYFNLAGEGGFYFLPVISREAQAHSTVGTDMARNRNDFIFYPTLFEDFFATQSAIN